MHFPPPLLQNARIGVLAPSGPFDRERLQAGLERLEAHFQLLPSPSLHRTSQGFLAGSDEERLTELQAQLSDPELDGIWVARGGYGLGRILPRLDYSELVRRPKALVGFSDVSALHFQLSRRGLGSLHAANITGLASLGAEDFEATLKALARPGWLPPLELLPGNSQSTQLQLRGPLVGGNLTVLLFEAASGRGFFAKNSELTARSARPILLLEDVGETSYRVDRMLTALLDLGWFSQFQAVVLGEFTDCSAGRFEVPVEQVLKERLEASGVPFYWGLPVGHGHANLPLWLGADVALESDASRAQLTGLNTSE